MLTASTNSAGSTAAQREILGFYDSRKGKVNTEEGKRPAPLSPRVLAGKPLCATLWERQPCPPTSAHQTPCWGFVGRCQRRDNQSMSCTSVYKERAVSQHANFATQKTMNRQFFLVAREFELSDNSALNPWLLGQGCGMLYR